MNQDLVSSNTNVDEKNCPKCKSLVAVHVKYCTHCGEQQHKEDTVTILRQHLYPSLIYYFIILLVFLTIGNVTILGELESYIWADIIFSALTVSYFIFYFNDLKKLYTWKGIQWKVLFLVSIFSVLFSIGVYYTADYINLSLLGIETMNYHEVFKDTSFPIFFSFVSVAVQPAILEEAAFRGFIQSNLQKLTSPLAAILVSGIMFGVMHLSIISLFWLVPLGIAYAWLRNRYQVMWYGMLAHFLHNSIILILELREDGLLFVN
jgi:membrane protease YdiL (CAAX protease family)